MTTHSPESVFRNLVNKSRDVHIEYKGFFANHLCQALVALHFLGASGEQLEAYDKFYRGKVSLEPAIKSQKKIQWSNWKTCIGSNQKQHYSALLDFFSEEVKRSSRDKVIVEVLPHLSSGIGAGAFHPLIQLGYGIHSDNNEMVAQGLAWLTFRNDQIPPLPSPTTTDEISRSTSGGARHQQGGAAAAVEGGGGVKADKHSTIIDALHAAANDNILTSGIKGEGFRDRRRAIVGSPMLLKRIATHTMTWKWNLDKPEDAMKELFHEIVGLFNAVDCRDFFILHGITGGHALRALLPVLPVQLQADCVSSFWQAVMIVYLVQGFPDLRKPQVFVENANWDQVRADAMEREGEHVIKACEALMYWASKDGDRDSLMLQSAAGLLKNVHRTDDYHFHD